MKLLEMQVGSKARVVQFKATTDADLKWFQRLKEFGMIAGAIIEMKHKSPWGGEGAVVGVRGADVALRGEDLNCIEVEAVQ